MRRRRLLSLGGCVIAASCSTSPEPARDEVRKLTAPRIEVPLDWTHAPASDEIEAYLERRLAQTLTARAAVESALANNPELRATLEELGVAQADLVQAGLLDTLHFGGGPRFPTGGGSFGWEFDTALNFFEAFLIPARRKIAKAELQRAIYRWATRCSPSAPRSEPHSTAMSRCTSSSSSSARSWKLTHSRPSWPDVNSMLAISRTST